MAKYSVDILYRDLAYRATIGNLVELDNAGFVVEFSHVLSGIGMCKFRVSTKDPLLKSEGNILLPYKYHVRVRRDGNTIWQGVITKNTHRNRRFIEVEAKTYAYLLDRVLIRHDGTPDPNYRSFNAGTMAQGITNILNEAKTDMGAALNALHYIQIDNPNFPLDFKDITGAALSGPWTFSNNFQIKVDYRSLLYVLQMFAVYADFDFDIDDTMGLTFKSYVGNKQPQLVFTFGEFGNVEDYDAPIDGEQMANDLTGVAADLNYNILHAEQTDAASIADNGKIMEVAAYKDVKDLNLLNARLKQDLFQIKSGDPELHLVPKVSAYPLGQYRLGDIISVSIRDAVVQYQTTRRIVSIDVKIHVTNYEEITLITNKPREGQS